MEWNKKNKDRILAKENADWIKLNGDLAYIDPISGKRITFEAIEEKKARARENAEKIMKRMGLN